MGLYDTLEAAGYTKIVQTDTIIYWDLALNMARHKAPITTVAAFHAKKDGKSFRVTLERHYKNRSSEQLLSSRIRTVEEVSDAEYDAETAKIGPFYMHKRF